MIMMLTDVLAHLRCPICGEPLVEVGGATLRCPQGHAFDLARHGYVNLGVGRMPHAGDSAQMVAARAEFLAAGHYTALSAALAAAAREAYPGRGLVTDVGAGTGHHLAQVLDALPGVAGLAIDVSKPALRRAARAHPRAGAALCDVWRGLPLADGSVGVLLNVFAPRNGAEFRRVLRADGALVVVTPNSDHLNELVDPLPLLRVDPAKEERVAARLAGFAPAAEAATAAALTLGHAEVGTLVGMGPSAWHAEPDALAAAIAELPDPITVTLSVRIRTYRPV
jgi:23S rRNA (guanine745-N1)-methyltransferase